MEKYRPTTSRQMSRWCKRSIAMSLASPDLSNVDQPHFVCACVALTPEEGNEIKDRVIRDYRVNGIELKGKNLVKYAKGRRAVSMPFSFNKLRARVRRRNERTLAAFAVNPGFSATSPMLLLITSRLVSKL